MGCVLRTHGDMALGLVRSIVDGFHLPDIETPEWLDGRWVASLIVGIKL